MVNSSHIFDETVGDHGGYVPSIVYDGYKEFSFCNTSLITDVSRHFKKYGEYPFPPPKPKHANDTDYYRRFQESAAYDAYKKFWDEETKKRKEGIIIPGALRADGSIEKLHIQGKHYSYLNYTQIIRDDSGESTVKELISKNKPRFARKVGESDYTFPDFWDGDYHYFTALSLAEELGLNLVVDKTRQVGYSYKNSSIARDEYDLYPRNTTVIGAYDTDYLTLGDSIFNMVKKSIDHINKYTDWKKEILINNNEEIRSGYRYAGSREIYGYNSKIICVSFYNKPGAAKGKKARKIFMEEAGKFPNLKASVIATNKSLHEGTLVTGIMIIFGTGGGKPGDWEDFQYIFYHPSAFNCLPFRNIWDNAMENSVCGYFHPRYVNLRPYYDKNGNTDLIMAKRAVELERKELEDSGNESLANENAAEYPVTPSESFSASSGSIFNTPELRAHKTLVENNPEYNFGLHGLIVKDRTGKLRFKQNNELPKELSHAPIVKYNRKAKDDITGCITIWDYPYRDTRTGKVPDKLYYIVHDPFSVDTEKKKMSVKHSLGCTYVYMALNNFVSGYGDKLVAKYMGRPTTTDEYNRNMFNLAEYYNCTDGQLWFERDRGDDVLSYAKRTRKLSYLNVQPTFDMDGELDRKVSYGVRMTPARKLAAIKYLNEWLHRERSVDEVGNSKLNLHYIFDVRLLEELQMWNIIDNFDGVSTLFVLMFLEQEITYKGEYPSKGSTFEDTIFNPSYLLADDY